jgi:hypothetical protein
MESFAASRLCPGDSVYFVDADEYGRVVLLWSDRVRIHWDDDSTSELYFDDCEGLERVSASDPLEQEKIMASRLLEAINAEET